MQGFVTIIEGIGFGDLAISGHTVILRAWLSLADLLKLIIGFRLLQSPPS